MFPYDPGLVAEDCAELDLWRQRLDWRGALPRVWAGRLRRDLQAEAVAASLRIENIPVTVAEVLRILAGDQPETVSAENVRLVAGYRDAMQFVLRRADDPAFQWQRELLTGLHNLVMSGKYEWGAGVLATTARFLRNEGGQVIFVPAPAEDVPRLVDSICERMNQGPWHPAVASAWVHVAFASVHPFRDGNGRTARVLSSLAMYRGGFKRPEFTSLEEWWGAHRAEYYAAFGCLGDHFDPLVDVTHFVRAHVRAQLAQVRVLDLRERVHAQVWTGIENVLGDLALPAALGQAVWEVFFGRDVSAGYYRSLAGVSAATATNHLARAVSAELLRKQGEKRGRRYFAGRRLFASIAGELGIQLEDSENPRLEILEWLSRRITGS